MSALTTGRDRPGFRTRVSGGRFGVAAALAAVLGVYVAGPAQAQDPAGGTYEFLFVSVSQPVGAAEADPALTDRFGMSGDGSVTVQVDPIGGPVTEGEVQGGGTFNHWDSEETLPVPKPILAQGTWTADKLTSW